MTSRSTLTTEAQAAVLAATVISTGLRTALANLDVALAGWPTSTPGAGIADPAPVQPCKHEQCTHIRPCPEHDDVDHLKVLEDAALNGDRARQELERLTSDVHHLAVVATRTANTVTRWAYPGLTDMQIRQQLAAVDATVWCKNCVRYGRREPKLEGRTECKFCAEIRRDYEVACPKEIWDARDARGGRIDVLTIDRILKRIKQERAEAKKAAAQAKKRAAETAST